MEHASDAVAYRGVTPKTSMRRKMKRSLPPAVWSFLILVLVLAVWQWGSAQGYVNPIFLSSPADIAKAAWELLVTGELFTHVKTSAYVYVVGVVSGCIVGAVLGLAMGWWKQLGDILDPYVVFFSAMPRIALYPVLMMIFGIGEFSRILIVFLGIVFPVLFNAYIGAKQTPKLLLDAGKVFGYSRWGIFTRVVVPAAMPYLMAGVRNGATLGMILVVVSEFFGSSGGLGQQIGTTAQLFQTPQMYAWVFYTSLLGLLCVRGTDMLERRLLRWT